MKTSGPRAYAFRDKMLMVKLDSFFDLSVDTQRLRKIDIYLVLAVGGPIGLLRIELRGGDLKRSKLDRFPRRFTSKT